MNKHDKGCCLLCKFNCSLEEEMAVCEIDDKTYKVDHLCKEFTHGIGDRDTFGKNHLLNI